MLVKSTTTGPTAAILAAFTNLFGRYNSLHNFMDYLELKALLGITDRFKTGACFDIHSIHHYNLILNGIFRLEINIDITDGST